MSDNPIWMRMNGFGNAIAGNQKPHWSQRNPVVPGAGRPSESEIEIPYIATISGGINVDEAAARQECQLCTALCNFFGGDNWEGCTEGVFTGQDCALICDTLIAHKTLLRKSRDEGGERGTEPLYYWKMKGGKPVLNLMVTKKYTAIPIAPPEWCLDASVTLCYNPDEKFVQYGDFAYCLHRELCFYTPRLTTKLYCLCTYSNYGQTGWRVSEQVSDEYFYGCSVGGWRDDTYQGGDGYSSRPYQTLAQMLIPTGETAAAYEGFDTPAQIGYPIPDWQDPDFVGTSEGVYIAPMMYLAAGNFFDFEDILKKTYAKTPYGETGSYYCVMLYPHIQERGLPGIYRCSADGKIYDIVVGECSISHDRESDYYSADYPCFNMVRWGGPYSLHVEYYENFHPLTTGIVDGDASVTIEVSPIHTGTPPSNIESFTKIFSFYFTQPADLSNVSAELILEDGKTQADYGVTDINIVYIDETTRRVDITVDLLYCYTYNTTAFRVLVRGAYPTGSTFALLDLYLPEKSVPQDLVWEPVEDPGYQRYCRILPPRHF